MKKIGIYIVLVAAGLLIGYFLFGNPATESPTENGERQHSEEQDTAKTQYWTCSMHPQIHQPEPGNCPICGMELIPEKSGGGKVAKNQFRLTKTALALANVETSVVGDTSAGNSRLKLSGKIETNEKTDVTQVAYFDGRIENLNVSSTGEKIRRGQLLATVYSPELVSAQQELLTAAESKQSNPQLYRAVRNKLKSWKLTDKQIDQIEQSGKTRDNFPVYATMSGTVTKKAIDEGDYIKKGQVLFDVADLSTVWAVFDVYENQLDQVSVGQTVTISSKAYPGKTIKGKITFIEPTLNTPTRTVDVRAVLNNKKDRFKPGMFVEASVDIAGKTAKPLLTVPKSAVLWTGKRSVVYVQPDPEKSIFELREVGLGQETEDSYQILSGLQKGEEIVTHGAFTVDAAAQLQGKPSMMNQKGGETSTGHEGHTGRPNTDQAVSGDAIDPSKMEDRLEAPARFQKQLKQVFDGYINLKDALVNDNAKNAQKAAETIEKSLGKVDMNLLKADKAHRHWMTLQKEIESAAKSISSTSDLTKQREHFIHLSAHLISSIKLFGINREVYVLFCPMANSDQGATWLSLEKQIRNPYYGQKMMGCGEVRDSIE